MTTEVPLPEPAQTSYLYHGVMRRVEVRSYTADQLRQHEARVREQIAGEIDKAVLPECIPLRFAGSKTVETFTTEDLRALRLAASRIALGTTTKEKT